MTIDVVPFSVGPIDLQESHPMLTPAQIANSTGATLMRARGV